tara:strand:- start:1342 stop:1896 length:555 start_codon:yes stop_codon:yes gene_type:complete
MSKTNIISLFRFQFNLPNELCIHIYNIKKKLEENESRKFHILRHYFHSWYLTNSLPPFCSRSGRYIFDSLRHGEVGFWLHYKPINNDDMNYFNPESEYHYNYNSEENIKICKTIDNLNAFTVIKDIKHYEYLINNYYQNDFVPDEDDYEPFDAINCLKFCKKGNCECCQRIGHYGIRFLNNMGI